MTALPNLQQIRTILEARGIGQSAFTQWSGVTIKAFDHGRVRIELAKSDQMTQHHGFLHGAMIGYLVDTVCAWSAATKLGDVLSAHYSVNFLSPGVGDRFEAEGVVVKAGKRQAVVDAQIFAYPDGNEKLIATGTGIILPVGG